ncbi:PRKC apoptosis WT1 regulator protein-like [Acipenser oxyrinchus oxyrinchus]|uniref:PRKC apoptosis WT1 regulator protein-like n=1 Tax=Acipenser oxyrinchus oxyrinchus TaxID=40147 RepID=A0AAD8G1N3_ACIOX|nr:PRKC apoptosis WT1 regulator protein-like [Acipenser oxyrinchus oxyrinchus]
MKAFPKSVTDRQTEETGFLQLGDGQTERQTDRQPPPQYILHSVSPGCRVEAPVLVLSLGSAHLVPLAAQLPSARSRHSPSPRERGVGQGGAGSQRGAGVGYPSPRGKEQKGGASAHRKNKTQVEKRKLREKRRSTGVVNLPLGTESPDEGEGGAASEKQGHPDLPKSNPAEAPRVALTRQKSRTGAQDPQTHPSEPQAGGPGKPAPERETLPLERRLHELEKVVSGEKQANQKLSRQLQEKEGLILKLQAEIGHMSEDLDGLEQENHTLREENQTLLRVVGQLTSS